MLILTSDKVNCKAKNIAGAKEGDSMAIKGSGHQDVKDIKRIKEYYKQFMQIGSAARFATDEPPCPE